MNNQCRVGIFSDVRETLSTHFVAKQKHQIVMSYIVLKTTVLMV